MIQISEYKSLSEFQKLRTIWGELHQQTRNASYFQSWDWLNQYLIHQGENVKPRILTISLAGRIIGIVPFIIKPVQTKLGNILALTYPLDSWGIHYSSLGPNPAASIAAAMRHLNKSRRDWDILDLRYIDEMGIDSGRTRNAMRLSGFQRMQRVWSKSSVVKMNHNVNSASDLLPKTTLNEYRISEKVLSRFENVEFHRYRPEQSVVDKPDYHWEIFSLFEKMSRETKNFCPGLRENPASDRDWKFLRCVHEEAVRSGNLDLCWLTANDEVIAISYQYHHRGRLDSLGTVYSHHAGEEAANVLIGRMMEDGFERFDLAYYMNHEKSQLKLDWGNEIADSYRYSHYPLVSARSQLLRVSQWVFHREEKLKPRMNSDYSPEFSNTESMESVIENESRFRIVG